VPTLEQPLTGTPLPASGQEGAGAPELPAEPWQPESSAQPHLEPEPRDEAPEPAEQVPLKEDQPTDEQEIDPALQEIFHEEAVDILGQIDDALRQWTGELSDMEPVGELKRALHTLKGSARMAGANAIGDLSHNTESLLKKVEDGGLVAEGGMIGLLEEVHDTLVTMVDQMQNRRPLPGIADLNGRVLGMLAGEVPPEPEASADTSARPAEAKVQTEPEPAAPEEELLAEDEAIASRVEDIAPHAPEQESPVPTEELSQEATVLEPVLAGVEMADTADEGLAPVDRREERRGLVRVNTNVLENLSNYAGEVSITRSRLQQQVFDFRENLRELNGNVNRFRDQIRELEIQAESQIMARPAAEQMSSVEEDFDPLEFDRFSKLQTLSRSLSESLNDLLAIQSGLGNFVGDVETVLQQQARLNTELQEGLMRTRMVSFATQTPRLRHLVRQTARELDKQVNFEISGDKVEIDRKVLERMLGPFEHMIRNAIDHGIESEEQRRAAGKPEAGTISVSCFHEGNEIVILFGDDGAGLDLERIRAQALERGLIHEHTSLSDEELSQLIMAPGFSTAEQVTQLSGRGVGMDVVHNEVRQLGGSINIESTAGGGAQFTVRLPLTLAIMQALVVRAADQFFAIPVTSIINIIKVKADQLPDPDKTTNPAFEYQGQVYPYMRLADRLGLSAQGVDDEKVPVLIVRAGTHEAALQVGGLKKAQEIVVKTVGPQVAELPGIAGATILGDGSVVLILDLSELWVTKEAALVEHAEPEEAEDVEPERALPLVMVVDDSLTVRKVTDRHLRKSGMDVVLAKDGLEALEKLREVKPDVMLVDIEMPRMDGYELTSNVRSDPQTQDIPIIIITSRSGSKHRDKAMQLGANVYLTKPYQPDELLSHIESLLTEDKTVH
jgi:chemosensory pili system protein ChpA (sensor histidine kinase/response regulator)